MNYLAALPRPSPEDIRHAREDDAKLTQAQAGALIGLGLTGGVCKSWADYERGERPIPPVRWSAFLLAVDAHPFLRLVRRLRPLPAT